jgi:hypothetical protein
MIRPTCKSSARSTTESLPFQIRSVGDGQSPLSPDLLRVLGLIYLTGLTLPKLCGSDDPRIPSNQGSNHFTCPRVPQHDPRPLLQILPGHLRSTQPWRTMVWRSRVCAAVVDMHMQPPTRYDTAIDTIYYSEGQRGKCAKRSVTVVSKRRWIWSRCVLKSVTPTLLLRTCRATSAL